MSAYTSNSCFDAGYSKLLLVKTITAAFWIFSLCKAGKNKIDTPQSAEIGYQPNKKLHKTDKGILEKETLEKHLVYLTQGGQYPFNPEKALGLKTVVNGPSKLLDICSSEFFESPLKFHT